MVVEEVLALVGFEHCPFIDEMGKNLLAFCQAPNGVLEVAQLFHQTVPVIRAVWAIRVNTGIAVTQDFGGRFCHFAGFFNQHRKLLNLLRAEFVERLVRHLLLQGLQSQELQHLEGLRDHVDHLEAQQSRHLQACTRELIP